MSEWNLKGIQLGRSTLESIYLKDADLTGAKLPASRLVSIDLTRAKARRIDLSDAAGSRWVADQADLAHARLSGIRVDGFSAKRSSLASANLERAQIPRADLRGANLNGARLDEANLAGADLRGTDLKDARIQNANFAGAVFDEATVLDVSCRDAVKSHAMIWKGADTLACDERPPRALVLSADFALHYPGVIALIRGDGQEIMVYLEDGLEISPLPPQNETQSSAIVCAARLEHCLDDATDLGARWKLRSIPTPVLDRGVELYHGPLEEAERTGRLRLVGGFRIGESPALKQLRGDSAFTAALLREASRATGADPAKRYRLVWRTLLDEAHEIFVEPHWLALDQDRIRLLCEGARCFLALDYFRPLDADPHWFEQMLQGIVRGAQIYTATVSLRLNASAFHAFGANLRQTIPVRAINHVTIDEPYLAPRGR